jgi:quercetin dioxygenase-like cupin family protein
MPHPTVRLFHNSGIKVKRMSLQAQLIHSSREPLFNILGPVIQFLVDPTGTAGAFGLIRGVVAPGIAIPLHSHADPEVIYVLEGVLEFLQYKEHSSQWLAAKPGDVISIQSNVKHALRNTSSDSVTLLLATTPNIYSFFRELANPGENSDGPIGPPTPADMERLLTLSAKHHYWIASPQENAAIGLNGF